MFDGLLRKEKKSYTLIEILFVVIVLGLLVSISLPRLGGEFLTKMKIKTQSQKLVSDLRRTRSLAITNNSDYTLTINSTTNLNSSVLYVGTGGTVKVLLTGKTTVGEALIFANVPDGSFLPVTVDYVLATGTTASDIISLK